MMENTTKYCSDYVLAIADKVLRNDFVLLENNLDIQREYYGKSSDDIRVKLRKHIDYYKSNKTPKDEILPLRLFTFFTVASLTNDDETWLGELVSIDNEEIQGVVNKTIAVIRSGKLAKYWE